MVRVPAIEGTSEPLAELMDGCLGNQSHGHLSIANVEVLRAGAFPSKRWLALKNSSTCHRLGKSRVSGSTSSRSLVHKKPLYFQASGDSPKRSTNCQ